MPTPTPRNDNDDGSGHDGDDEDDTPVVEQPPPVREPQVPEPPAYAREWYVSPSDTLMPGERAVDRGTDLGLPYCGAAPDIGAVESDCPEATTAALME